MEKEKSKLDVHFIELYIKKMYGKDLASYYLVSSGIASKWRNGNFPESRVHEFAFNESSSDVVELIKRIYNFKEIGYGRG